MNIKLIAGLALAAGAIYLYRKHQKENPVVVKIQPEAKSNFNQTILYGRTIDVKRKSNFMGFGLDGNGPKKRYAPGDRVGSDCLCKNGAWGKECCGK